MCDYANYLERKARNEGINQGKKIERKEKDIEYVRKLMERLQMSFKEAVSLLEIPEKEIKEIENLSESLKDLNVSLDFLDKEKVTIDGQILLNEQQNETLKKKMYDLDQEVNGLQGQLLTAMNNVNELETQKVEIDTNRKHILENTDKEDLQARIAQMKAILQDIMIVFIVIMKLKKKKWI